MKTLFVLLALFSLAVSQPKRYLKEFNRPANATAYAAGDNVCASDSLPLLLVPAGEWREGDLVFVHLAADTSNATNASFRLWLYTDSLGQGKVADNAAFANSMKRDSLMCGYVDFTLSTAGQSGGTVAVDGATNFNSYFSANIRTGSQLSRGLWGRLIALAAYQPARSGRFRIVSVVKNP